MATKLMSKLFSDQTAPEFKEKVSKAVEAAKETGKAEIVDGDENLQFASVDGGVIVEDQANDNEVTMIRENLEDPNDLQLEEIKIESDDDEKEDEKEPKDEKEPEEKPEEKAPEAQPEEKPEVKEPEGEKEPEEKKLEDEKEPEEKPEVKVESTPEAVVVEQLNNANEDEKSETVPEVTVEISTGIEDPEKAGLKSFSITFKNATADYISKTVKTFSDAFDAQEKEQFEQGFKEGEEYEEGKEAEEKQFSKEEKAAAEKLTEEANELQKLVAELEETKDKELAEKVKEQSEKCIESCAKLKEAGVDTRELEDQVATFAETAAAILDEAEKDEKPEEKEPEAPEEKKPEDEKEPEAIEVTEEQRRNFSSCLGTKFGDVTVTPVVKPEPIKTFSQKTEQQPVQSLNPFLSTKFE